MLSSVSVRRGRRRDRDAFLTQQKDVLPRRQLRAGARGHLAEDAGPGGGRRQRWGRVPRFPRAPPPPSPGHGGGGRAELPLSGEVPPGPETERR